MVVMVVKSKVLAVEALRLHVEKTGEAIMIHLTTADPIHLLREDENRKRYHARETALAAAIPKTTVVE